jgi:hypothetical protein
MINVDEHVVVVQSFPHSLLGLSFRYGCTPLVRYFIENLKASIKQLHNDFRRFAKTPCEVMCEHDYLSLVKYFLPVYLKFLEQE